MHYGKVDPIVTKRGKKKVKISECAKATWVTITIASTLRIAGGLMRGNGFPLKQWAHSSAQTPRKERTREQRSTKVQDGKRARGRG